MTKIVYVGPHNGLGNRLEMFLAAQEISARFGHEVWIDWFDANLISLPLCHFKKPTFLRRVAGYRCLKTCVDINSLRRVSVVDIRTVFPFSLDVQEEKIKEISRAIRPAHSFSEAFIELQRNLSGQTIVGVHLRQGDFLPSNENFYSAIPNRHTRVPVWWYEHMMGLIVQVQPEVTFLLAFNGDPESAQYLKRKFRCVLSSFNLATGLAREGHLSVSNPVFDLFALASCPVILGTPASSFTHWAASNLGEPSVVISPALKVSRDRPTFRISRLRYQPLSAWVKFSWYLENEREYSGLPNTLHFDDFNLNWYPHD